MDQGVNFISMVVAQNLKKERAALLDHLPPRDGLVDLLVRLRVKVSMAYDLELPAQQIRTVAHLTASAVCGLRAPSLKRMVCFSA